MMFSFVGDCKRSLRSQFNAGILLTFQALYEYTYEEGCPMDRRKWLQMFGLSGVAAFFGIGAGQGCTTPTAPSEKTEPVADAGRGRDARAAEPGREAGSPEQVTDGAVAEKTAEPAAPDVAAEVTPEPPPPEPSPSCVLSPEQMEGPFYFDPKLDRKDITESRKGTKIALSIQVVAVETARCRPLEKVIVDVWHADAGGLYSGYTRQGDKGDIDTRGKTFMRGSRVSDKDGKVEFTTVFPGWYTGRVPHIHVKLRFSNRTQVVTQLYFPEAESKEIYARKDYQPRGQADTDFKRDVVLKSDEERKALSCVMSKDGDGFKASITLGVKA